MTSSASPESLPNFYACGDGSFDRSAASFGFASSPPSSSISPLSTTAGAYSTEEPSVGTVVSWQYTTSGSGIRTTRIATESARVRIQAGAIADLFDLFMWHVQSYAKSNGEGIENSLERLFASNAFACAAFHQMLRSSLQLQVSKKSVEAMFRQFDIGEGHAIRTKDLLIGPKALITEEPPDDELALMRAQIMCKKFRSAAKSPDLRHLVSRMGVRVNSLVSVSRRQHKDANAATEIFPFDPLFDQHNGGGPSWQLLSLNEADALSRLAIEKEHAGSPTKGQFISGALSTTTVKTERMTIKQAKAHCKRSSHCVGFTFENNGFAACSSSDEFDIEFKAPASETADPTATACAVPVVPRSCSYSYAKPCFDTCIKSALHFAAGVDALLALAIPKRFAGRPFRVDLSILSDEHVQTPGYSNGNSINACGSKFWVGFRLAADGSAHACAVDEAAGAQHLNVCVAVGMHPATSTTFWSYYVRGVGWRRTCVELRATWQQVEIVHAGYSTTILIEGHVVCRCAAGWSARYELLVCDADASSRDGSVWMSPPAVSGCAGGLFDVLCTLFRTYDTTSGPAEPSMPACNTNTTSSSSSSTNNKKKKKKKKKKGLNNSILSTTSFASMPSSTAGVGSQQPLRLFTGQFCSCSDGRLNKHEFSNLLLHGLRLRLLRTEIEELFALYDNDGDKRIGLKEFLIDPSLMMTLHSSSEMRRQARATKRQEAHTARRRRRQMAMLKARCTQSADSEDLASCVSLPLTPVIATHYNDFDKHSKKGAAGCRMLRQCLIETIGRGLLQRTGVALELGEITVVRGGDFATGGSKHAAADAAAAAFVDTSVDVDLLAPKVVTIPFSIRLSRWKPDHAAHRAWVEELHGRADWALQGSAQSQHATSTAGRGLTEKFVCAMHKCLGARLSKVVTEEEGAYQRRQEELDEERWLERRRQGARRLRVLFVRSAILERTPSLSGVKKPFKRGTPTRAWLPGMPVPAQLQWYKSSGFMAAEPALLPRPSKRAGNAHKA